MESSLLKVSFAIAWICWFCGFIMARPHRQGVTQGGRELRLYLAAGIGLPILVFLATLPSRPPMFVAGHGLGIGFLLGGLGGLLAGWTILCAYRTASAGEPVSRAAAIAAPTALAVAISIIPVLWLRDNVLDALAGVAIGWLCSSFLLVAALQQEQASNGNDVSKASRGVDPTAYILSVIMTTGFAAVCCAIAALGEIRAPIAAVGNSETILHWSSAGQVIAAGVALVLLLTSLPAFVAMRLPLASVFTGLIARSFNTDERRLAAARAGRVLFCMAVLLGLGKLLANRYLENYEQFGGPSTFFLLKPIFWFLGPWHLFHLITFGLCTGLLLWWVTSNRSRSERDSTGLVPGWQNGALATLVLLGSAMVAFQFMGGFGVGILLISAWPIAATVLGASLEHGIEAFGPSGIEDKSSPPPNTEHLNTGIPHLVVATHLVRLMLFGVLLVPSAIKTLSSNTTPSSTSPKARARGKSPLLVSSAIEVVMTRV